MSATDDNTLYFDVQHKTDKQHILDNPDTYIGSVETVDSNMWIMNETNDKIIEKNISYIPGLFKLFDEGIVNCRDHVVRMQSKIEQNVDNSLPVTYIDVSILDDDLWSDVLCLNPLTNLSSVVLDQWIWMRPPTGV